MEFAIAVLLLKMCLYSKILFELHGQTKYLFIQEHIQPMYYFVFLCF